MAMVRKSFTLTEQQDLWLKTQMASGHYGNESEIIRELIRERNAQFTETPEQIGAIRAALIEGEQSEASSKSIDDIWKAAITAQA